MPFEEWYSKLIGQEKKIDHLNGKVGRVEDKLDQLLNFSQAKKASKTEYTLLSRTLAPSTATSTTNEYHKVFCSTLYFFTDGNLSLIDIKFGSQNNPAIKLSEFDTFNMPLGVVEYWLTYTHQPGKTLKTLVAINFDAIKLSSLQLGFPEIIARENIEGRLLTSLSRTGRVIWQDDFENYTTAVTEKYRQLTGTLSLDTTYPFRGKNAMKMLTGTAATNTAQLEKYIGCVAPTKLGLELWFRCADGATNITAFDFDIAYYDGVTAHFGNYRWQGSTNKKWQFMNTAQDYENVTNGTQDIYIESTLQPLWHYLKVTADVKDNKNGLIRCDDKVFDLTAKTLRTTINSTAPQVIYTITVTNQTVGAGRALFLDDIVLTVDEPI